MGNQTHITLYTLIGKFERVRKSFEGRFSNMTKEISASTEEGDMERFVIQLQDDSNFEVNINHDAEYISQQIPGMCNFFAQVECANQKLQHSVIDQIRAFNCVIGTTFELYENKERTDYIVNTMFAVANELNAIVLMPDMRLFTGEGKLLFSTDGSSDFEEYMPIANADYLDNKAEEAQADIERRERSIAFLKKRNIPYFPQLRAAVVESEVKLRSTEEIAKRLLAMFGVCVYSEVRGSGETWDGAQKYLNRINEILDSGLKDALSPQELAFLATKDPMPHDLANFGWRYECCHILMWALGKVEVLEYPDKLCDVSAMGGIIWNTVDLKDLMKSVPRTRAEILDAADLILRYDWACVDARVNGKKVPAGINAEVVMEWHYAFNWLIGWGNGAGWDNISTNT